MGCTLIKDICDGFGEYFGAGGLMYGYLIEGYCHGYINGLTIVLKFLINIFSRVNFNDDNVGVVSIVGVS